MKSLNTNRKGFSLNNRIVAALPFTQRQYTVWDKSISKCGVRVSPRRKTCVISVRIGAIKKFETIGVITPEHPYGHWKTVAKKRIVELIAMRTYIECGGSTDSLRAAMEGYIAEHPKLSDRTQKDYRFTFDRYFGPQLDELFSNLSREKILHLNREHLKKLTTKDPDNNPPRGFYGWKTALRNLRAVVRWRADQKAVPDPWPGRRALPLQVAPPRSLPVELQSAVGRRQLIQGLKLLNTNTARGCLFLCYTGLRRREGMLRVSSDLIAGRVLEFRSKTRTVRIPLSK